MKKLTFLFILFIKIGFSQNSFYQNRTPDSVKYFELQQSCMIYEYQGEVFLHSISIPCKSFNTTEEAIHYIYGLGWGILKCKRESDPNALGVYYLIIKKI